MQRGMRRLAPLLALLLLALSLVPASAGARGHDRDSRRTVSACASSHASVERASLRRSRLATLCLLNRVRTHAGLPKLRLNPKLSRAARVHSRDMVRRGYFAHDSLNGRTPFQRMLSTRYVPRNASWWLAENIGWGTSSVADPAALVRMWMRSAPHRANILNGRFREIGIGIALGIPVRSARFSRSGGSGATYTTDFGFHS